jgi:hypothetical protein
MAHPLDGALAKVRRAEEHLSSLQQEVGRWREQNRDPMARENNSKRTEFRFYTNWSHPPDPVRWALLLGDGIHNLRSALDHLVYACSGPYPPKRCEFPIMRNRDRYFLPERDESGGLYKIRGIRDGVVRTFIEEAQPWKDPQRLNEHWFWIIHQLDIQDKHRLVTPVALVPKDLRAKLSVEFFRNVKGPIHIEGPAWVPLQNHALVMTVTTPKPARRVEVNAALTFGIAVKPGETDMGITAVLGESCKAARYLIEQIRDSLIEAEAPAPA